MVRRILLGVLALLLLTAGTSAYFVLSYPSRKNPGSGKTVTVSISRGMSVSDISDELERAGVIDRPLWFHSYVSMRKLGGRMRAGTYHLRDDLTPKEVIAALLKGSEEPDVSVTIPEGKNVLEVCALIDQAGLATAAECEATVRDRAWLAAQKIDAATAEGYLYPDTYRFKKETPIHVVLETLVKRHRTVYAELAKEHAESLAAVEGSLGWHDRDVVILASIVERETGAPDERARVASVMVNRLLRASFPSHRLETDPATRYGCIVPAEKSKACSAWDPSGPLHRAQLDDADNAYNTYEHAGLPPGPIANPGRASLAAAMAPEQTDYLFFVAKDERSHVFSKTYEEHARWVQQYKKEHQR